MSARRLIAAALIGLTPGLAAAEGEAFDSSAGRIVVERMADGLDQPWGFVFLPDGDILFTEKAGVLRILHDGAVSEPIDGAPGVEDGGQGGLLDVALAQDFAETGEIFLSYSASDGFLSKQTAVARARLARDGAVARLEDVATIFRQEPSQRTSRHYGSRIVIAPDGSLFVTVGERGERDEAQNPASHQGSVIRILRDGSPRPGNPFIDNGRGWRPEIWSYGHRNPQGATLGPGGALWVVEHGPRGGDELNRPEAGVNYGWPMIGYGRHYSGARIGVGTAAEGMAQPVYYWDPSIAPSGLAYYDGEMFPEWRGDFFVGALKFQLIARLDMNGDRVADEERLFENVYGRIRDIRVAPDGAIWFATDSADGGLYRISRAD